MIDFPPPVPGVITQYPNPGHDAYDFACRVGTPIIAVHDGTLRTRYDGRLGHQALLVSPEGYESLYAHMERVNEPGEYLEGEVIGYCGNTGSWTTGPHLHFESTATYTF